MQFLIRVRFQYNIPGRQEDFTRELKINPSSKNKLKNFLYLSFPYGAWFTQEMMRKGKCKVTMVGEETFINRDDIEKFDAQFTYELLKKEYIGATPESTEVISQPTTSTPMPEVIP